MDSFAAALSMIPRSKRARARIGGFYSFTWLPILAGAANAPSQVTSNGATDFIATRLQAYATTTANPPVEVATPQATLTLVSSTTNVMIDSIGVHLGILASSAAERRVFEFPAPIYIPAATTLTAFLTSLFNADMNVRIVLEGIQVLTYDAPA